MPSFDISSEVDHQEVTNAMDQAAREVSTRFDFRDTNSAAELGDGTITIRSMSEDRLRAVRQVVEEKLVRRKVSLKALDWGNIEPASGGTVRQVATLVAGISEVEARRLALFSAQSAYEASQVGLEVGTRTVLDVLDNQRTLFTAQQVYARVKYNFLQNRLLLEQAAGTLGVSDVEDVNRLLTTDKAVGVATATP